MITMASDESIRAEVVAYLQKKLAENKNFRVLEIGACGGTPYDEYVHTYVDLFPVNSSSGKPTITGDIGTEEVWKRLGTFDFIIISHVLEDIRDPSFVLKKIVEHSGGGFIAVPNKHTEFGTPESWFFPGYSHHRWIFTVQNGVLRMIAKWPVAAYYSRCMAPFRFFSRVPLFDRTLSLIGLFPGGGSLP